MERLGRSWSQRLHLPGTRKSVSFSYITPRNGTQQTDPKTRSQNRDFSKRHGIGSAEFRGILSSEPMKPSKDPNFKRPGNDYHPRETERECNTFRADWIRPDLIAAVCHRRLGLLPAARSTAVVVHSPHRVESKVLRIGFVATQIKDPNKNRGAATAAEERGGD